MNPYARRFRLERRRSSTFVRVRNALLWLGLGCSLGWAVTWMPSRPGPESSIAPLPTHRISADGLRGRKIFMTSSLAAPPGVPEAGLAAWLKTFLEENGAEVAGPQTAQNPGDPPPALWLKLEPANVAEGAPVFAFAEGDSMAARVAAALSAQVAADFGQTLVRPEILHDRHLKPGEPSEVLVRVGPAGTDAMSSNRLALSISQGLARQLAAAAASLPR